MMETYESFDGDNLIEEKKENTLKECIICRKNKLEYMCMPCRCKILCKKCAMKMASGGKCRNCKNFFVECKRIL